MKENKPVIFISAILIFLTMSCLSHSSRGVRGEELFPDREYMRSHSEFFFKRVNLSFPPISNVEFFVRSETYASAYIHLSDFAAKIRAFSEWESVFGEKHRETVMLFNEKFKGELRLENYEWASRELGLAGKPLTFYLLLLYTIRNDYRYNTLSGRNAFAMWNVVLLLTKNAYKSEKGFTPAERAGVLKTAAHLVFFRDAAIWGKRGESLARKLIRAGHTPESLFPL